jgi:DNA-binding beta-propeller fold protein YncE
VWGAIPEANIVVRIDPETNRQAGRLIPVGAAPASIDYGDGSVWVANSGNGTVTRISPKTARAVGNPRLVGGQPVDLTVSGRYVYVLRADGVVRRITAA